MAEFVLVAGSRTFTNKDRLAEILAEQVGADDIIVEGGARGVDLMAREWAESHGRKFLEFAADWKKYGRAAGPKRNDAMTAFIAENGGKAVYIWDGESKGTKQCILSARKQGIPVRIYLEKE